MSTSNLSIYAAPLEPVLREAGKIAMHYFGSVTPETKADNSPVSKADREVERFLVRELTQRFPDHAIVGEEFGVAGNRQSQYVWAIDPIDGTAAYLANYPTWTVCIGLLVDAVPTVGLVYMPVTGDLYTGDPETGARLNGNPIRVMAPNEVPDEPSMMNWSHMHQHLVSTWPGRIWSMGSAAHTVISVAGGKITAGLIDRVQSYDIAGAAAILRYAGGELRYLTTNEIVDFHPYLTTGRFEDNIVACHPDLYAMVRSHFSPKS